MHKPQLFVVATAFFAGAARPADPSLRHSRNRQRELALQKPKLRFRGPRIAPGGSQRLPTRVSPSLVRALRDARGSPPWTPGTTATQPPVWVPIGR